MLNSKPINPSPAVKLDNGNIISLGSAFHKEQQSTIITKTSISNLSNVFGAALSTVDYQITPHTSIDKCNFAVIELEFNLYGKTTGSLFGPVWNLIDHIDYMIDSKTVDTVFGENLFQELSYLDSNVLATMADALGYNKEDFFFPGDDSLIINTVTNVKRFIPLLKGPLTSDINWKAIKSTVVVRVYFKKLSDIINAGSSDNSFSSTSNPPAISLVNTQLTMGGIVYPSSITNNIIANHYTKKDFVAPVFGRRIGIFDLGNSLNTSTGPKTVELSQFKGVFSNISFFCKLNNNLIENSCQSKLNAAIPIITPAGVLPPVTIINKSAIYPWVNLKYSPNTFKVENIVFLDSQGSVAEFTALNSGSFIKSGFNITDESPFNSTYSIYNLDFSDKMGGLDGDLNNSVAKNGQRYIDGLYSLQLYFPSSISSITFENNVRLYVCALQDCSLIARDGKLDFIRH